MLDRSMPGRSRGLDSLRAKIALLLALLVLALMALVGYQAYRMRLELVASAMERVSTTVRVAAQDQSNAVTYRVQRVISVLSESPDIQGFAGDPGCPGRLAATLKTEPYFANIAIIAPDGDVACAAIPATGVLNVGDRDYFSKALTQREPVIGEPMVGRISGKWELPFALALRDGAGRARGVLLITLDLEWLNARLDRAQFPDDARVGLIGENGVVIARHPDPENWIGRNASQTPFFKGLKALGGIGTVELVGFDGVPRIYGLAPFARTLAGQIYLWVGVSRESVVGAADREFVWTLAGGLLLLGAMFGAAWTGADKLVLRRVGAISAAAQRLGKGDARARTGIQHTNDEFGQLAQSFDQMASSLESANQAVTERTAQLESANKELEAFSYSVSHDLRAPLRSIDGFSQVLLEDYEAKLDDEGKDSLHRVREASQRMAALIDDMLKLSRATRGELNIGPVDLSAMAESTIAELRRAAPGREVKVSIAPGVTGQGDARLLGAVLENLLSNAWKFTGKKTGASIEFRGEKAGGELVCQVRDNGAGFDMAYAGNLFTPFQRLHQAADFPGNGIGLATVKRIIARLGGRAWAEGAVNQGATFRFSLPCA